MALGVGLGVVVVLEAGVEVHGALEAVSIETGTITTGIVVIMAVMGIRVACTYRCRF